MPGSPLEVFQDFVYTTGPSFLTGPEDVVNDVQKRTYGLRYFLKGKDSSEVLQGGSSIKDDIYLAKDSTFANYGINEEFDYRLSDVLSQWEVHWRFSKADMSWTDHEIELNTSGQGRAARHQTYKRLKRVKEMNLWQSICDGLDDQLWALPSTAVADMETSTGEVPYSIPVFVNELTNGLYTATQLDAAFTTIQGLAPATYSEWVPAQETYAHRGAEVTTTKHLFKSMARMWHKIRFERLPTASEMSDPTSVPGVIMTSMVGVANYEEALRMNQDLFVYAGRQDPSFPGNTFRGTPMVYIAALDTASIFPTGTSAALGTELDTSGTTNAGPRYFFLNMRYLKKVFHESRWFYKTKPFSPTKQPFTHVMVVDMWHNLVCTSRRHQGIVYPNADVL